MIEVNTVGFEKVKKSTQEELDRITAENMRIDEEIETFIETTKKDSENFVKALEGKEV